MRRSYWGYHQSDKRGSENARYYRCSGTLFRCTRDHKNKCPDEIMQFLEREIKETRQEMDVALVKAKIELLQKQA